MPEVHLSVDVLRLRAEGWLLPRFRLAFLCPVRGSLVVREEPVPELNRHVMTARLQDASPVPTDLLPPLRDVVLRHMKPTEWVLTGFERVTAVDRETDHAQTWLVMPAELRSVP